MCPKYLLNPVTLAGALEKCVELVLCKIELLGESFSEVESRWGKQSSEIRKAGRYLVTSSEAPGLPTGNISPPFSFMSQHSPSFHVSLCGWGFFNYS